MGERGSADWQAAAFARVEEEARAMLRMGGDGGGPPPARLSFAVRLKARVARRLERLPWLRAPLAWLWALARARATRILAHQTRILALQTQAGLAAIEPRLALMAERLEQGLARQRDELAALGERLLLLQGGLDEQRRAWTAEAAAREAEGRRLRAAIRHLAHPALPVAAATSLPAPTPSVLSRLWDAELLAMTDETRGSEDEIRRRVSVHLPVLRRHGAGLPDRPILDLGCGRGEWLEVLASAGLRGEGVETSPAAVARCREKGLRVHEEDALALLGRLPDASLGGITLLHVIEHLDLAQHARLFDEALRTLKPGGVLLMETPNGENFSVSGRSFWFDPTHRVLHTPASLLRWFRAAGFEQIAFARLHPYPAASRFPEDAIGSRLNEWFLGEQDFAVWGVRPEGATGEAEPDRIAQ